jgi:hypothetical protein
MLILYCAIVRRCVRIRIGLKPILGLAIIVAGILASHYINVLRLDVITLAAVAVLVGLGLNSWISINKADQEGNRYIYESAFKCCINGGELCGVRGICARKSSIRCLTEQNALTALKMAYIEALC